MSQLQGIFDEDDELSPNERAIIEKLLEGNVSDELKQESIPRRKNHSPVPLSYSQQRLWVLDRLVPGNPFYNASWAFQLSGEIDIRLFEQCVNEINRRHEVLRTVFTMENRQDEPVQVILEELPVKVNTVDMQDLPPAKQKQETARLAGAEAGRPFDLEKGPLLRVTLLQWGPREHILLMIFHHIIFDGWSVSVLIRELGHLYEAVSMNKPSGLPTLPIQYADFALWQRQRVQGEVLEKQLSFWKELLGGELPIMELPTDRQRPAVPTYRGSYHTVELADTIGERLIELSQKQGCSMFMTLLAALNVLYYRYSGQEDILIGSPVANRNRLELEHLIGYFSNTLVFRTHLSGNPTFLQLLARVRKMASSVYDNQDLPFEKLVEKFQPDRYMSHTPFFQVMLHYGSANVKSKGTFGPLTVNSVPLYNQTSKFDLWFNISQHGKTLKYGIEYNSDIFDETTIIRMMGHINTLLAAIGTNPHQRINDLPILTEEEKTQILVQWNDTRKEYHIRCLHHQFEARVKKTPDMTALIGQISGSGHQTSYTLAPRSDKEVSPKEESPGQIPDALAGNISLTYCKLNEKANQLAKLLKEKGVQVDSIVGIIMERSVEMVIGLLGILKAGGAYLPIDPDYPEERKRFMLEDSHAQLILVTGNTGGTGEAVVDNISMVSTASRPKKLTCSEPWLSPVNASAYIIYTSGSTGSPKGVIISHQGISNRLYWMQEAYGLTNDDRILQKTPYNFDVSVWEFFWPLLNGAVLVMACPGGHKDSAYLIEIIVKEKITTIHFVPTMLNVFLEDPGLMRIRSLKRVICSGEALPIAYRDHFFKHFQQVELHNLYGPTEASVDVTAWSCQPQSQRHIVPLGKPIANTNIYILDRNLNPVPVGVYGELHIGGIQLARGYLNQPELTAEKFCLQRPGGALFGKNRPPWPPPKKLFIKGTGKNFMNNQKFLRGSRGQFLQKAPPGRRRQKKYSTGDLARWLPDGCIEFLGRMDFQVKVRGFRIEIGEIESKLRSHPYIEDTVVTAAEIKRGSGDNKLTAYMILNPDYWGRFKEKFEMDLAGEQVFDWQQVFDDTYKESLPGNDPLFNIIGWNSSYTGAPIPAAEMRQWVDYTVERILSLKPGKVLEIGCGTGLLLFRIIPHCESYIGTDISKKGLDYIQHHLVHFKQVKERTAQIQLMQKKADDLQEIETQSCDLVILNSVVQYFPGAEYLLNVLKGAIESVKPGGSIFIGDVRILPLLKVFHTSVEYHKSETGTTRHRLHRKVVNRTDRENELFIDPVFFTALEKHLPRIKHVEIHLKRGQYRNELTRFRYDVILRIEEEPGKPPVISLSFLDWHRENLTLSKVRQVLTEKKPAYLAISGIPNSRIAQDLRVLKWLESHDSIDTVDKFLQSPKDNREEGIDPENFWRLAEELPYHVDITLAIFGSVEAYEVVFRQRTLSPVIVKHAEFEEDERMPPRPFRTYVNNPLLMNVSANLVPELRGFLNETLPEYMVPSYFIFLASMPLTHNGKLDRKELSLHEPLSSTAASEPGNQKEKPRTDIERFLADNWKSVLLIDEPGINDNFFQLGGDSVNAIQVISRINKRGYKLSVRHLYQNMTIAQLADYIEKHSEELIINREVPDTPGEPGLTTARDIQPGDLPPVADAAIEDIYPVTPFQEHMLAYYLKNSTPPEEPGLFVNQVITSIRLGAPDILVMKKAFRELTDFYPYLRTAFTRENGKPGQVIHRQAKAQFQYLDLNHLTPAEREKQIEEFLTTDREQGFERNKPNANRISVIRLSGDDCLLVQTSDLMRVDGWSAMIVMKMFSQYVQAMSSGQTLELSADNCYKEYITWISRQDENREGEGDYWRRMVRGCIVPTPLIDHTPRNSPGKRETNGFRTRYFYFSRQQTAQIDEFLKQRQMVLSALGTGIWSFLLSYYTNQKSVIFGMLLSGRSSAIPGIETMIGQAMNILPMRVDIAGDKPVSDWLKEIMAGLIELNRYDFHRQDKIREIWNIPAEVPLFESYFVLENFPGVKESKLNVLSSPGSSPDRIRYAAQMEYPLRVELFPLAEMRLTMHYYRRWFTEEAINVMIENFHTLMSGIIKNPGLRVGELSQLIGK